MIDSLVTWARRSVAQSRIGWPGLTSIWALSCDDPEARAIDVTAQPRVASACGPPRVLYSRLSLIWVTIWVGLTNRNATNSSAMQSSMYITAIASISCGGRIPGAHSA
jgi:hypothetical protein